MLHMKTEPEQTAYMTAEKMCKEVLLNSDEGR